MDKKEKNKKGKFNREKIPFKKNKKSPFKKKKNL